MNQEMYDLCNRIMHASRKQGATDCKVSLNKNRNVEISYREKRPETIKEATTRSLNLQIYIDGRYSDQSTPDLRDSALDSFVKKACENTRYIEQDPFQTLPEKEFIENQIQKDLDLFDDAIVRLSPDEKHEMVRSIEYACLKNGGDQVISVEAESSFNENESVVLATNGFEGTHKTTSCWAGAFMSVKDQGDRKPSDYYYVNVRHLNDLPSLKSIGEETATRALRMRGSKKISTNKYPIIVENRVVGRLLQGLISATYGGNIQQERSFLANKEGEQIASPLLSIIDAPLLERKPGSRLFDGDGFPSIKRSIVENGTLNHFLIDWYYSRKLQRSPTTGSFSNMIIPAGNAELTTLMNNVGKGILITGFIGGNSNSTTGDFSIGINGQLFEDGKPVQAISEMNIADNHLHFWNKLAGIANDPWLYGSWMTPSLMFEDIMVSGI